MVTVNDWFSVDNRRYFCKCDCLYWLYIYTNDNVNVLKWEIDENLHKQGDWGSDWAITITKIKFVIVFNVMKKYVPFIC